VLWTPAVLIIDADGAERHRIEGYLPNAEFRAQLELGLARMDFMHKHWADAERRYGAIAQNYPALATAPEALYWRGVSPYKATNDHLALGQLAQEFKQKYQDSIWAEKASVWA
jgi:TolA-binding protein